MRYFRYTLLLLLAAPTHAAIDQMTWNLGDLFDEACALMEVDCKAENIPGPLLIVTDFGRNLNALGLYPIGTNIVLITAECNGRLADRTLCDAVLVHELVHYISFTMLGPLLTQCESESMAWDAFNAYVMEKGRYDLTRSNWTKEYPQCAKSPDSSTSSVTP